MFESLSEQLGEIFKKLRGHGRLTEENIAEALEQVKRVMIDADAGLEVTKEFLEKVRVRAIGAEVLRSITPGQMVMKIVHDELTMLMGRENEPLNLAAKPPVAVMLVGLQGSGKTTTAAKLARHLKKKGRSPLLVPADVTRPAAIEQLKTLAGKIKIDCYDTQPGEDPIQVAENARERARKFGLDLVIIDTAGRLHVDEELMDELARMKDAVFPKEILLVADAMTGQDAVNIARQFHEKVGLTGCILTKLDGDARGGAALSVKATTNVPIKFIGTGEDVTGLELFHPERMAGRILDLGDVVGLVEKAQEAIDAGEARKIGLKLRRQEFTIDDFKDQLLQLKRLGAVEETMKMLPGMGSLLRKVPLVQSPDAELKKIEAIINSMTKAERHDHALLDGSRKKRIAVGCGAKVEDINRFLKQFLEARKMMKQVSKLGPKKLMRSLSGRIRPS